MSGGRVLIAHRDAAARQALAAACAEAGMEVAPVSDAAGVAQAIDAFRPDLVLLDAQLPGAEEALRTLRELGVAVVSVSPLEEISGRLKMLLLGADETLIWPASPAEAAARARTVLLMRRYRARVAETERELAALGPVPAARANLRALLQYESQRARRYRHPLTVAAVRAEDPARAMALRDAVRAQIRSADTASMVGEVVVAVFPETGETAVRAALVRIVEAAGRAGTGPVSVTVVAIDPAGDLDGALEAAGLAE
jgi:CheY-like chemotaxis protein